ncbi:MAG: hypothetical protein MR412_04870 [Firmicutes bacterium]|nr:hypothetical protein [Bacillota bacterium]
MWEITLLGNASDIVYYLELKNTLKRNFGNDVLAVITFEKALVISIAVLNKAKIAKAKNLVMQTIIRIVKVEYMQNNLKCFCNDKSLNSFLLSNIITLDMKDEVKYALQVAKLSSIVNIRSFVLFKLHNFIDLWEREIAYLNAQFSSREDDKYLDLLKFIANNNSSKWDILYLETTKDQMFLLDKKRNTLKAVCIDDEVGIIANLVMFAPKKLIINCSHLLSDKVSNLIAYIFEDKISVLL